MRLACALGIVAAFGALLPASCARAEDAPLAWRSSWGEVSAPEYFTMIAASGVAFVSHFTPAAKAHWGGNALDDAVRGVLRLKSSDARAAIRTAGDVAFFGLMAYPIVVDGLIAALPRDPKVSGQTIAIDVESLAVAALMSNVLEGALGRERPFVRACRAHAPDLGEDCDTTESELSQSMPSGHTLLAFAGAGLICAHHMNLPLYGGGAPDIVACSVGLAGATFSGLARLMADRHYFTDVVAGAALGLAAGLGLPYLLHYGRSEAAASAPAVTPIGRRSAGPMFHWSGQF